MSSTSLVPAARTARRRRSLRGVRRPVRPRGAVRGAAPAGTGVPRGASRPEFSAELAGLLTDYTGRPSPITEVPRFAAARRPTRRPAPRIVLKREDLNHTGSHKINNVLGQALLTRRMGKTRVIAETGAGPARGRDRDRGSPVRSGLHRLHGQGRHPATGAQRGPDAAARRRGDRGRVGHPDAQGRDERGDARLGRQRRQHPLPDRHRRRAAPVPDARPGVPADHQHRGAGPDPRPLRPAARTPSRPASAAARTPSASSPTSSPTPTSRSTGSRPAATGSRPAGTPQPSPQGEIGVLHGMRTYVLRTKTARPRSPTRSRPASTIPASGPSTPGWPHRPRALRADHRRRGDGGLPAAVPDRGHRAGDRVRPRAGRRHQARQAPVPRRTASRR